MRAYVCVCVCVNMICQCASVHVSGVFNTGEIRGGGGGVNEVEDEYRHRGETQ